MYMVQPYHLQICRKIKLNPYLPHEKVANMNILAVGKIHIKFSGTSSSKHHCRIGKTLSWAQNIKPGTFPFFISYMRTPHDWQ